MLNRITYKLPIIGPLLQQRRQLVAQRDSLATENEKLKKQLQVATAGELKIITQDHLLTIDRQQVTAEISANQSVTGVFNPQASQSVIISLTSFPERMSELHFCLHSLCQQQLQPNKIILWLAKSQFPRLEKDLPSAVLAFKKRGVEIKWTNRDLKSYKKIIPTLKKYPDAIIVTADDDIYYPPTWLAELYQAYQHDPGSIHAHRGHIIGYQAGQLQPYAQWQHRVQNVNASFRNFATGAGGILYPPQSLFSEVTQEKLFQKICPTADDVWLWGMAVMNKTPINIINSHFNQLIYLNPDRENKKNSQLALSHLNSQPTGNDQQLRQLIEKYPLLDRRLRSTPTPTVAGKNKTAERLLPEHYRQNRAEFLLYLKHQFAYYYASQSIQSDFKVLDYGCGDGYGAHYLATQHPQAEITGGDIDQASVEQATQKYQLSNLKFVNLDDLVNEQTYDLVTSFQVIEHVPDVELFLKRIKTLLKPSGMAIISTPSRTYRLTKDQTPWNEFHLREYDMAGFQKDINQVFPNSEFYALHATKEILGVEFNRAAQARADQKPYRRYRTPARPDFQNFYRVTDFYLTPTKPDEGLDLFAVIKPVLQ